MNRNLLIIFPVLFSLSACQTTPGDAALKGGHVNQAAELYKQGAEQGNASAAMKLAYLLDDGKVNAVTYGVAGKWYIKACDLGSATGCHNAGVGYEYGSNGLSQNINAAGEYYLKAAESGYMQSQYNLASMHSNQYLSNDIEGLKWMTLARMNAKKCAQDPLCEWILNDPPSHHKNLRSRLSEKERATAEARAIEWLKDK